MSAETKKDKTLRSIHESVIPHIETCVNKVSRAIESGTLNVYEKQKAYRAHDVLISAKEDLRAILEANKTFLREMEERENQ